VTRPAHQYPSGPDPFGQGRGAVPQDWDEQQWRRPEGGATTGEPPAAPENEQTPAYQGPPRAPQVPGAWRPPTLVEAPSARRLPEQNEAAIDAAERQARTVTHGVGLIAGAILVLLLAVLCGRLIF